MADQPPMSRSVGDIDPPGSAATRPPRRDFHVFPTDAPRVDARTAELRERIASAARIWVISALITRR